jgi:hypothetical protein
MKEESDKSEETENDALEGPGMGVLLKANPDEPNSIGGIGLSQSQPSES